MMERKNAFVGFEYMEVPAKRSLESLYVDSYPNFGWEYDGTAAAGDDRRITLKFKRDRKIRNKAELSRLQRQFEACVHEIEMLEQSETKTASIAAFTIGVVGTVLLGGATFAYLGELLPLMIVLAVPGFLGWILPYFCYKKLKRKKVDQVTPIIEKKQDEIYTVCEQGCRLLTV